MSDLDNFWSFKESLVEYLGNMKSLKGIKIMITTHNYNWVKWVLEKLNKMTRLLSRLENLSFDVSTGHMGLQELFQNKKIFSHLTGLRLLVNFDPMFCSISEI